ncbi:protein SAR DEFICIENT 1 [Elaeis guineensis]|uniref:Protein SAR DEFICIENT 1 n=1 Tax=Elaeis guineensis var. tenera TaxID=51953 RepID=A0A6I9RH40_ELAGV|nr:protein SAR DEFICIENT 1 [Elaeis guineensis]
MAAKRLHNDSEYDKDPPEDKRMRRLPSFSTVIREAMMAKSLQNFFMALEPLFRKVVQEEVDRGLVQGTRLLQRPSQMHNIEAAEPPSMKLIFKRQPSPPIFTGSKVEDEDNKPLQVLLVDTYNNEIPQSSLPSPLKVEVVVLDGDFPSNDHEDWTSTEFQNSMVKERTGRRPLITGEVNLTLRDGTASISDLTFTDNSSWIRSRHFRIGARIVPGSYDGPKIKEAMTEPFTVKDHRGELYRKHYPPTLGDEVWRLEKIGKDGAFHKRLSAARIDTVQDFLKLSVINPDELRRILGVNMSDRMWEGTHNHARTCHLGDKVYLHRGQDCTLLLNSICEVVGIITTDGVMCTLKDFNISEEVYVQQLVREAYQNWDKLEEADGLLLNANVPLLQNEPVHQGGMESLPWYPVNAETAALEHQMGGFDEAGAPPNNLQLGFRGPAGNPTSSTSPIPWNHAYMAGLGGR